MLLTAHYIMRFENNLGFENGLHVQETLVEATKRANSFLSSQQDSSTSAEVPAHWTLAAHAAGRSPQPSPILTASMNGSYAPGGSWPSDRGLPLLNGQSRSSESMEVTARRLQEKEIELMEKDKQIQHQDAELKDLRDREEELQQLRAVVRELDTSRSSQPLLEELQRENRQLTAQLLAKAQAASKTEADRFRALANKQKLETSLRQSERELESLRQNFLSLDEEHVALKTKGEECKEELRQRKWQLRVSEAEKTEMEERARELEAEVLEQRALHEKDAKEAEAHARSQGLAFHARRARELEVARRRPRLDFSGEWGEALILGDGLSQEILARMHSKVGALQADNEHLRQQRDATNASRSELAEQLKEVSRLVASKDAEVRAAAAVSRNPLVAGKLPSAPRDINPTLPLVMHIPNHCCAGRRTRVITSRCGWVTARHRTVAR